PPTSTVPTATTLPTGTPGGISLQVCAGSPLRAAPLPLMNTVVLPAWTTAWLLGGTWKKSGGGTRCGGTLSPELPTVAAGRPPIFTSALRPPVSGALKGNDAGAAAGPAGVGVTTTWASIATTLSPCLAAGCPMVPRPFSSG